MLSFFCIHCGSEMLYPDDRQHQGCPVCGGSTVPRESVTLYLHGTFKHNATGTQGWLFTARSKQEQDRIIDQHQTRKENEKKVADAFSAMKPRGFGGSS